jgi:hypothetical protein
VVQEISHGTRNPKSEIRKKSQIPDPESVFVSDYGHWGIGICFGFRVSGFGFLDMPIRVAATTSFVVFAVCLVAGADNTFGTAVGRALTAMMATLAVGLVVGWMGEKMIEENVNQHRAKAVPDASEATAAPAETAIRKDQGKTPEGKTSNSARSDNRGAKTAAKKDGGNAPKRGR